MKSRSRDCLAAKVSSLDVGEQTAGETTSRRNARTSLDLSLSNHGPKTVSSQYTSSPVPLLKDKECFQHISI